MAGESRRTTIKSKLATDYQVSVSALAKQLGVTEETIRRDLEKLEAEGFLNRTYGGAILNTSNQKLNAPFYKRQTLLIEEKRKIARNVMPLLEDKSVIALDSSSTSLEVAKLLKDRDDLVILTNSVAIFGEFVDSRATIVSTGGQFDSGTFSLVGESARESLSKYRVDVMLFSCKGIDENGEVLDSREDESEVKRAMFKQAGSLVLLADHSKFNRSTFVRLTDLSGVDYLVTDQEPSDEWKRRCEEFGVSLIH